MLPRLVLSLLVLPTLIACASSGSATGGAATSRSATPSRSRNVLTAEEIATANVSTAAEAVERLRPQFLRMRGAASTNTSGSDTGISVFLDGIRLGGVEALQRIQAGTVREIRYISASDATTKYGTGYRYGAIEVFSKR